MLQSAQIRVLALLLAIRQISIEELLIVVHTPWVHANYNSRSEIMSLFFLRHIGKAAALYIGSASFTTACT